MANKTEDITLIEALSFAAVRKLPDEWDGKSDYTKAIALVKKTNNKSSYVVMKRDETGKTYVIRDFGEVAGVVEVLHIYPYDASSRLPLFKNRKERIQYAISKHLIKDEESGAKMKTQELDQLIRAYFENDKL